MSTSDIELQLTTEDEAHIIKNLWALYVHDLSAYDGRLPNRHGVYGESDEVRSLDEGNCDLSAWWKNPEHLFPYLVLVDGTPAGFNLIATGPYVPSEGVDFVVHEFFIAAPFRGSLVAQTAAQLGIAKHRGSWEVVTYPNAARPIAFWRKALPSCASAGVAEIEADHAWGRKVVFTFDNLKA